METLASLVDYLNQDLAAADATLKSEVVAGISLGALAVFLGLLLIPILTLGVNRRAFLKSFFRGIVASAVFLATNYFYTQMETLGRFYLLASMIAAIVVTFIIIEILVSMGRKSEKTSLRTDMTASIASGMAFGLIVKLASYGWTYLRALF